MQNSSSCADKKIRSQFPPFIFAGETMDWAMVVFLLTNYFIQQRYIRNVIFLNCMNNSGKIVSI